MISLVQMEYIVALAHYQSFSVAAEKCFVTQPTLSMQIKKMEEDLNVILFDRSKKPVAPTQIGEALIEQAKIILAETAKIEDLVQISKQTLKGTLRVGIIPSLAPYLLPGFIGKFVKKHPGIKLVVKELLTEEIMEAVDHNLIDTGLVATPLPRKDFKVAPLFYERILIYCHKNHDFAGIESVDITQMREQKIWLMSNGNCFRNQVVNVCELKEDQQLAGFSYESASIETLIKLVEKQGGMTVIPELAANLMTSRKQQNVKPFKGITPVREISLITNRIFVKKRMIEALMEEIKATVSEEMLSEDYGEVVSWT